MSETVEDKPIPSSGQSNRIALFLLLSCCPFLLGNAPADRPAEWAQPMDGYPGLENFSRVNSALYRGAQPEDVGFEQLEALGVKTVINLRTFHSDRKETERNHLNYIHIPVQAWEGEDDEVVEFLKAATDPQNQPVFVHCKHGADRTGVMSAAYRIVVQGWSKEAAIKEMTEGGFGFHSVWQNLVDYVEELDVETIRRLSGVDSPETNEQ